MVICSVCNGSRTVICSRCGARADVGGHPNETCPECQGTGVQKCPSCGGMPVKPDVLATNVKNPAVVRRTPEEEIEQIAEFLGKVDLFKKLSRKSLEILATRVHLVSLPDGHVLRENDPTDGLYIIKSGMARVTKPAATGKLQVDLATLRRGNAFGEIGLIDGLPRSANVTATEPMECYYLPRPVFLTAMEENPEIAVGMLPALAAMVRNADQVAQTLLTMFSKEN